MISVPEKWAFCEGVKFRRPLLDKACRAEGLVLHIIV